MSCPTCLVKLWAYTEYCKPGKDAGDYVSPKAYDICMRSLKCMWVICKLYASLVQRSYDSDTFSEQASRILF